MNPRTSLIDEMFDDFATELSIPMDYASISNSQYSSSHGERNDFISYFRIIKFKFKLFRTVDKDNHNNYNNDSNCNFSIKTKLNDKYRL